MIVNRNSEPADASRGAQAVPSADYVLDRFHKSELATIDEAVRSAANAVEMWVANGIDQAMNRFNIGCKNSDDPS